jgi:hypothetical protein
MKKQYHLPLGGNFGNINNLSKKRFDNTTTLHIRFYGIRH